MTRSQQKSLAERIKARRKAFGYTQENFSELIGLTYSSYVKIENAFQNPSLETLMKISKQLDLSLDYIVFGTEERKPAEVTNQEKLVSLLKNLDNEKLHYTSEILALLMKINVD